MPIQKKPMKKKLRPLSDVGLRRQASWGRAVGAGEKRHHQWICNPGEICDPKAEPEKLQSFTEDPNWRIFRIMAEFVEGFQFLDDLRGEVSIFGSTRAGEKTLEYKGARKLGALLAKNGYTVITGGGPGIMEAANRGAYEAGGESIGIDIELPTEQRRNQYVTRSVGFHYFFTRKVILSAAAQAYVFFPGGFGTLDEMTEMVTLIQTGKIPSNVPVVLVGKKFWSPFLAWVKKALYAKSGYIAKMDLSLLQLVDTPEQALAIIQKTHERPYGSSVNKVT
jgi:uncharacterized protein (TIGR00730 family)